jgi:hypothetical protein
LHESRLGLPVRATTVDAESLKAPLHIQRKLNTPRRENRKILHKIEILKAKKSNDTKKHTTKSRKTIPLRTVYFYFIVVNENFSISIMSREIRIREMVE